MVGIQKPLGVSETGLGQPDFDLADVLTEQQVSLVLEDIRNIQVHISHLSSSFF